MFTVFLLRMIHLLTKLVRSFDIVSFFFYLSYTNRVLLFKDCSQLSDHSPSLACHSFWLSTGFHFAHFFVYLSGILPVATKYLKLGVKLVYKARGSIYSAI